MALQTVTDILHQSYVQPKSEENKKNVLQCVSDNLQRKMEAVCRRYGNREKFLHQMSPIYQTYAAQNPDKAFFGDAPTLAVINTTYGKNTAVMWLIPQLNNVSRFCGCKERLTDEVTEELARSIAAEYYYLKTSELMLFLQRFKMGHYGRFYGAVDPLVITTALQDFLADRRTAYAKHQQEEERKQREAWEKEERMTYEEYKQLKEQNK